MSDMRNPFTLPSRPTTRPTTGRAAARRRVATLGVAATMLTFGGINAQPARAVPYDEPGCSTKVRGYLAPTVTDHTYRPLVSTVAADVVLVLRLVTQTYYAYCTAGPDRIKPKWIDACYTWIRRGPLLDERLFRGVDFRTWSYSAKTGRSGYEVKWRVPNSHQVQNCARKEIPARRQEWFHLDLGDGRVNARRAGGGQPVYAGPDPAGANFGSFIYRPGGRNSDLMVD